jgi:hypothetical protein
MQMNPSVRSEAPGETAAIKEHRRNPGVDSLLQELYSNEQFPPRNAGSPFVPNAEVAFETFVGGTGI